MLTALYVVGAALLLAGGVLSLTPRHRSSAFAMTLGLTLVGTYCLLHSLHTKDVLAGTACYVLALLVIIGEVIFERKERKRG